MTNRIYDLCQPIGGLLTYPYKLPVAYGEPRYPVYGSALGDLSQIGKLRDHNNGSKFELTGAGGDYEEEKASLKALAETLERYCSAVYDERQFIWATAAELGDEALDLDQIAVCSEAELSHPQCPITRPDKKARIRWVRGISLISNRLIWVPAVMVYLHIPFRSEGERFWLPISTGCASHTSYEQALVNGINEVIERDAIALTWLHRLPLKKIEFDRELPDWAEDYIKRNHSQDYLQTYYFNATTELGIPTIYSVQVSEWNRKLSTVVMCTTELDPHVALTKITREAASVRIALQHREPAHFAADPDTFIDVFDGALYMGTSSMKSEFDFLTNSEGVFPMSEFRNLATGSPYEDLKFLLRRLEEKGHEAIAVDLSTDESLRAGFYVVRVIIPGLQPLSFAHRARYLGHGRLYSAPVRMGYGPRTEADINPLPQPMA